LLFALEVGAFGKFEQFRFGARIFVVEFFYSGFEGAARVFADAPGDLAGGFRFGGLEGLCFGGPTFAAAAAAAATTRGEDQGHC
jgi:hypothetical protein